MNHMNTNTELIKNPSPALIPGENSRPSHTPAAPAENPVEAGEASGAAHAADVGENETGHAADLGHEPDRIQPQSAAHHPTNDHRDDSGMAREPVTRSDEAASPSIAPSELSSFANATLDEPPMAGGGLTATVPPNAAVPGRAATPRAPRRGGTPRPTKKSKRAASTTSITPLETPPMASGGLPTAALSQILAELATETRQAAAAHGDSLRAIHGAIHELRRAHQEVLSRLNQPQGQ
jgi:hypothetical protein